LLVIDRTPAARFRTVVIARTTRREGLCLSTVGEAALRRATVSCTDALRVGLEGTERGGTSVPTTVDEGS